MNQKSLVGDAFVVEQAILTNRDEQNVVLWKKMETMWKP